MTRGTLWFWIQLICKLVSDYFIGRYEPLTDMTADMKSFILHREDVHLYFM